MAISRRSTLFLLIMAWGGVCCFSFFFVLSAQAAELALSGELGAHDPSRITQCDGRYYVYVTGPDIPMRFSPDLVHWTAGPAVLSSGVPTWAHQAVPGATGDFVWAPDVLFVNHRYCLYYAFSTFGSPVSVIGLVTSPTLDPASPNYHWTDQGEVIGSDRASGYNAIDPCPVFDARGNLWLSFGSWNHGGIQIVPLDAATGKPTGSPTAIVKGQRTGPEGSFIALHGGTYYVFENEGLCCQGMNSTYRVMMGRAQSIVGPYLDKQGRDLAMGGGSEFLGTDGREFGPGQVGIMHQGKTDYVSFHFYDGEANGRPTLGLDTLTWGHDGWPETPAGLSAPGDGLIGHYRLISKATGLALGVTPEDKDGTPVTLSSARGPMQVWNLCPTGDGYFSVSALGDGKFLDLDHCSAADGATIDQYPWLNNDCQRWKIDKMADGAYRIVSKSSGKDVAVVSGAANLVQQAPARGDGSGDWLLQRVPAGE